MQVMVYDKISIASCGSLMRSGAVGAKGYHLRMNSNLPHPVLRGYLMCFSRACSSPGLRSRMFDPLSRNNPSWARWAPMMNFLLPRARVG